MRAVSSAIFFYRAKAKASSAKAAVVKGTMFTDEAAPVKDAGLEVVLEETPSLVVEPPDDEPEEEEELVVLLRPG